MVIRMFILVKRNTRRIQNRINWNKTETTNTNNMKKNIITGLIYFFAGAASVELITVGFGLMNKQSTILFWTGFAIVLTTLSFIGVTCYKLLSQFLKPNNK
jgi:hypothetical protein